MIKNLIIIALLLVSCSTIPKSYEINKIDNEIYVQMHKSEFIRTYHVKSEAAAGATNNILKMGIVTIHGITSVFSYNYSYAVTISPIFDWETIQPEILKRLNEMIEVYNEVKEKRDAEKRERI